jgi:hypothetical protein
VQAEALLRIQVATLRAQLAEAERKLSVAELYLDLGLPKAAQLNLSDGTVTLPPNAAKEPSEPNG